MSPTVTAVAADPNLTLTIVGLFVIAASTSIAQFVVKNKKAKNKN